MFFVGVQYFLKRAARRSIVSSLKATVCFAAGPEVCQGHGRQWQDEIWWGSCTSKCLKIYWLSIKLFFNLKSTFCYDQRSERSLVLFIQHCHLLVIHLNQVICSDISQNAAPELKAQPRWTWHPHTHIICVFLSKDDSPPGHKRNYNNFDRLSKRHLWQVNFYGCVKFVNRPFRFVDKHKICVPHIKRYPSMFVFPERS